MHAGKPFVTLCSRCGTYMCQTCTEDGAFRTCASCRAQTSPEAFPFGRENHSFFALVVFAFQAYRANWAVLTVALVISVTLTVGAQVLALSLPFLFEVGSSGSLVLQALVFVPQSVLPLVFTVGALNLSVRAARGEHVVLSQLFCDFRTIGRVALLLLLLNALLLFVLPLLLGPLLYWGFLVGSFSLESLPIAALVSIPVVVAVLTYLGLGLCFATLELVAQPAVGPIAALRNAWAIARSRRLTLLAYLALCFGLSFIGAAFCFIGLFVSLPYTFVLMAAAYLALRNGASGLET